MEPTPGPPGESPFPAADPPTPERASILVVDDRRANLLAMEALLAPLGRRVVLAESGEEALRILQGERFALILLDVQMPGMGGFETARRIRGRLRTRRIPIIFVTAITTATNHMFDGYAAGAVDYLLKPVDPVILRSKVTLFVELYELNARLQREAARRGMEESLALAQRAGLSGVWDWHLPSDRVRWSREYPDLVGIPAAPRGGPGEWLATVDPRDRDRVESRIADAVRSGGTWEGEFRVLHPARGPRWLSARGRVYRDHDDRPERFIGIAMDITERHRAEEDLRRLIATGDLHDNPVHLAKLTALAGLTGGDGAIHHGGQAARRRDEGERPQSPTHLLLHEIIHSDRLLNGMDFSFRALVKVAALKASFPERVHAILANHELAQVVGAGIVKDGVKVVEAFNMGVEYVFGDDTPAVTEAIGVFIKSMPLALRCHCGPAGESHHDILCAHSLPAPALMSRFDATVLSRDLTEADYEPRQGAAHLMVWGRGYDAEQIEDLVERWGVNMFILGHEKAENGVKFIPPCALVLNSDHDRGVYLPIDLEHPPKPEEAAALVVPLGG